jgi:hypothetical protein
MAHLFALSFSTEDKATGADNKPLSRAEVKNEYNSTPQYALIECIATHLHLQNPKDH